MAGLDSNRGAKRGREARAAFGLDPAAPLRCLLEIVETQAGLPVVVAPLPDGVAGACVPIGDGRLLFVNGRQAAVRQRFTLAHELGHARCGHVGGLAVETVTTLSGRASNAVEIQANAFAAEFLIPRAALAGLLDGHPTLDQVVAAAALYGTSAIMTLFRFKQAGLISAGRCAEIEAALDADEHLDAYARLALSPLADGLGTLEELPYLSPALEGTYLAAVVRGEAVAEPRLAEAISRLLAAT